MGRESRRTRRIKDSRGQLDNGVTPVIAEDDSDKSSSTDSDQSTASGAEPADEVEGAVPADSSTLMRRLLDDKGFEASQN